MAKGDILYKRTFKIIQEKGYCQEAYELLTRSHDLDNRKATYSLATWYLFGEYVKKDFKTAVELLSLAAIANIPEANFDLAVCYEKGKGIEKNLKKAFEFYLKAAILGDYSARFEVGRCYFHGIGVSKNKQIGNIWTELKETEALELF